MSDNTLAEHLEAMAANPKPLGWHSVNLDGQAIYPSKIVCVGRNYVEHIHELNNEVPESMVLFLKPNSAISTQLVAVLDEPLHYETELCFVYQGGRFSGVGVGLDLTKRELQSQLKGKGLPWERAKAFDGSAVFSEFVSLDTNLQDLHFSLYINDVVTQQGNIDLMIHKPADILAQISQFMTLCDGDIVMTGTPKGVGEIPSSSVFYAEVYKHSQQIISAKWLVA